VVKVDARYYRPTEVGNLIGDASKARERLGWEPAISFDELIHEMVWDDLLEAQGDELLRAEGFRVRDFRE
jgi:GDPmannose 4,6-dehydratase